jgi:tRNA (cmo5U34)-methyltransferase
MQTAERDEVRPGDKWSFDADVTRVFDDMLRRSIPQYDVMRDACVNLGARYVQPETDIVDLGCSRGEALAPFVELFDGGNRFIGCEISDPMLEAARTRFSGAESVRVEKCDLRSGYPDVRASVTLSILTLQFTPIEYRQQILTNVYEHTVEGGALVLVEKILGNSAAIDRSLVDCYYHLKAENGYSQEAIDRKRHSLEGVLVPVTAQWNEELLRSAGFRYVDCFWRWMNFAGWVAVKK